MWLVQLTIKIPSEQIKQEWFAEHESRNQKLRESGVIMANGPFSDYSGGCFLYNCENDEIESLVKEDPFVVNDVVDYVCKEWNVVFSPKLTP